MKIFRILAMLTISLFLFTGCEDDEITNYAFQDISAPENVTANFDVSQDDSGTVTITPSGVGAQTFQVDLGNGETAEVAAGESVTTVYAEGEYMVKIVGVGSTGLTSEYNQMLNISFKAPENLVINVDQPETNPRTITVSATADNATLFQVYFGDVEDEEPTQLMPGESISHNYTAAGVYELTVIAIGAGSATAEEDAIIIVPEAQDPLKLPVTFDDPLVGYNVVAFGAPETAFEIITNPDLSGDNETESMVGAITKVGAQFEGLTFNLNEAVDLSGDDKILSIKIWSDVAYPVLLKLETGVNDERANQVLVDHGGTGWETLSFDFGTDAKTSYQSDSDPGGEAIVPDGQYDGISLFLDFAGSAAGTFYVDDLMQEETATDCTAETDENIDAANGPINWTFRTTDDEDYEFDPFGDIASSIVSNPKTDGINPSCNVQIVDKSPGCATWSGVGTAIPTAIDFTTTDKKIFKLKVLAENQTAEVTLRLEKEPHPDVEPAEDRVAQITEVGVWQELTFDFSDVDDKTFRSIIIYFERNAECDGDVYYFDDLIQTDGGTGGGGSTGSTTTSFPVNFETAANGGAAANWSVFENVDNPPLEIISNPDMTGNTSATVAKFTARQDGNPWAGTITQLQNPFDLNASNSVVKIWVWKSKISDVGIKFENATQGSTGEIKVANTKVNEWEELTFDFSGVIGDPNNTDITGLVVFPDFEDRASESVSYFDNITLNSSTGGGSGGGTGTSPTSAAPTPTVAEANVISLFSDAYPDVSVDTWRTDWSKADYSETTAGGNNVKLYSNFDFVGVETVTNQVDASSMTHFHIDYWTGNASVFRVKLVDFGPDGSFDGGDDTEDEIEFTVTPNTWVSLDIPLSDFTGLINTENIAQYIFSAAPAGEANVYIDNVYFHN